METNEPSSTLLYVGTYTKKEGHVDGKADGIYILKMDNESGQLTAVDTIQNVVNPSYLALHPNGKYLYAVNEIAAAGDAEIGEVSAFYFNDKKNKFDFINKVSSKGDAPCHISVDASGKYVLVANYVSGNIVSLPILKNGQLGEAVSEAQHIRTGKKTPRQEAAHAHMALPAIDGHSVFSVDLGADKIYHYQLNKNGELKEVAQTPTLEGGGARHMVFHPSQKWCYVVNELANKIEAFNFKNTNSPFQRFQTIETLPEGMEKDGMYAAAIHIHPNGRFLYASNRGTKNNKEQSIAIFKINPKNGKLIFLGTQNTKGMIPRDFAIGPSGKFLLVANQNSDNIVTFKINMESGLLEETGIIAEVKTPVCLKFGK